jgi:predicted TIM-barrel fold metal-dependent hydrolase
VIERGGYQNYLFASDFLLEIGPDDILHEVEEVAEAPISDADKRAVLRENARRFYQIRLGGLAAESAKVTK